MPALVSIGMIQIGSASNQVAVFSGQNMQNAWDSNAANISTLGTLMGQYSIEYSRIAVMNNMMRSGQPLIDCDTKLNDAPLMQGVSYQAFFHNMHCIPPT